MGCIWAGFGTHNWLHSGRFEDAELALFGPVSQLGMCCLQIGLKNHNGLYLGRLESSKWAVFRPVRRLIICHISSEFSTQQELYSGQLQDSDCTIFRPVHDSEWAVFRPPIFKTTWLKVSVYTVTSRMSVLTHGLKTDVFNWMAGVQLLQITVRHSYKFVHVILLILSVSLLRWISVKCAGYRRFGGTCSLHLHATALLCRILRQQRHKHVRFSCNVGSSARAARRQCRPPCHFTASQWCQFATLTIQSAVRPRHDPPPSPSRHDYTDF